MSKEASKTSNAILQKFSTMEVPHTAVLIFIILILCAIATYLLPSGLYDYVPNASGRSVVDPDSFRYVESSPTSLYGFFNAIPKGLAAMSSLIFFVFIAGGSFSIINETRTLEIAINKIAQKLQGKEKIMIVIIMSIFSLLGGLIGFSAESIIFIPLGLALARKVGYDSLVGVGMIVMGAYAGFTAGMFNPYTTAVAQDIVGLPLFSGLGLRIALHIAVLGTSAAYVIWYAERVRKDPKASYVYELEKNLQRPEGSLPINEAMQFNIRHMLVLATMFIGFAIIIYGSLVLKWNTSKMAPVFFAMGIFAGILGGLSGNKIANAWLSGARTMVFAALVIGMGRGVLVVLQDGLILDTIVHGLAVSLQMLPAPLVAVGMMVSNIFINFFVPSGSGQATLVMPIMGPLAEITGVSLQTAVLAFQCGDGFTNIVIPTSATTNSCIGIAGIHFIQWFRFAIPLTCALWGIGAVFVFFASYTGY